MKQLKNALLIIIAIMFVSSCEKTNDPAPNPVTPPVPGAMTITSISPEYGKAGSEITITGTNFSATASANIVTLGGKTATVTAATSTQLKVTAPIDGTHGTIEVKVGTASATSATFIYAPEITSLSIVNGKVGDVVTITGKHFGTAATDFEVKFGSILAEISAVTATTLTVKVPAGATTGLVSVARKTKTPVNGPSFAVSGGGGAATGFTIIDGSVSITNLLKANSAYGELICMTVDEERNVIYAGTKTDIIKIDLATNAVSTIIKNDTFIKIPYGKPSAMDVDANGKLYLLAEMYGPVPTSGSNVYVIDPATKTAKTVGNRFVGVSLVGSFAINTPFQVLEDGEIIAFDQSFKTLCKFSPDLTERTVIYTLPIALETFVQLIEVNQNTVRIVLTGISGKYAYDYSTSLSAKMDFKEPAGFNMISQTMANSNKYGVAAEDFKDATAAIPRKTFTVGRLNAAQTSWEKKGSFIIETFFEANKIKYYNTIGLNGRNYFYADKNGNMYAQILATSNDAGGLYKISLN